MGRGGDGQKLNKTLDSVENKYKLSNLSTDELKKWCHSYGLNNYNGDRILMLKELVCSSLFSYFKSSFSYFKSYFLTSFLIYVRILMLMEF